MRIGRTNEALPPPPVSLAQGPESPPDVDAAAPGGAERAAQAFGRLLRGLGQELDRGESLAEKAIRGGHGHASLSPERLIALQAGIYRYSEAVDLATKLVDRGTQAVRTTLQNQ